MRKMTIVLALLLSLSCLSGCGQRDGGTAGGNGAGSDTETMTMTCRIVANHDGALLLAEQGDGVYGEAGVYSLTVGERQVWDETGEVLTASALTPGALIDVAYSGEILETYPGQFADVTGVTVRASGYDDLCALYLQVLEDLWNVDSGLNSDVSMIGIDLSRAPGEMTEAEKSAVAWRFGELHGCPVVEGTYEELADQGYIDREHLQWNDGCLFSIADSEQAQGEDAPRAITFDAEKWRSGTGAYFFSACTAVQSAGGQWEGYQVGSEAIS